MGESNILFILFRTDNIFYFFFFLRQQKNHTLLIKLSGELRFYRDLELEMEILIGRLKYRAA